MHGLLPDGAGLVKRKPASSIVGDKGCDDETVRGSSTLSCQPSADDGAAAGGRCDTDDDDDDEAVWPYEDVIREPFFWKISVVEAGFCVFWAGMNFHTVDVMVRVCHGAAAGTSTSRDPPDTSTSRDPSDTSTSRDPRMPPPRRMPSPCTGHILDLGLI